MVHFTAGGRWGTLQSAANEDAAMFLFKRTCFIVHIVLPLGAFKSQLGGTYGISLLFYIVIDSCVYIYICFILSFWLMFFAHEMGFNSQPIR